MWEVRPEPQFQRDYKRVMKAHPQLRQEFLAAVRELIATGRVPEAYHPHELAAPGGNYNGHVDFLPHKTNPVIRLVRMGSHEELFRGKMK